MPLLKGTNRNAVLSNEISVQTAAGTKFRLRYIARGRSLQVRNELRLSAIILRARFAPLIAFDEISVVPRARHFRGSKIKLFDVLKGKKKGKNREGRIKFPKLQFPRNSLIKFVR